MDATTLQLVIATAGAAVTMLLGAAVGRSAGAAAAQAAAPPPPPRETLPSLSGLPQLASAESVTSLRRDNEELAKRVDEIERTHARERQETIRELATLTAILSERTRRAGSQTPPQLAARGDGR